MSLRKKNYLLCVVLTWWITARSLSLLISSAHALINGYPISLLCMLFMNKMNEWKFNAIKYLIIIFLIKWQVMIDYGRIFTPLSIKMTIRQSNAASAGKRHLSGSELKHASGFLPVNLKRQRWFHSTLRWKSHPHDQLSCPHLQPNPPPRLDFPPDLERRENRLMRRREKLLDLLRGEHPLLESATSSWDRLRLGSFCRDFFRSRSLVLLRRNPPGVTRYETFYSLSGEILLPLKWHCMSEHESVITAGHLSGPLDCVSPVPLWNPSPIQGHAQMVARHCWSVQPPSSRLAHILCPSLQDFQPMRWSHPHRSEPDGQQGLSELFPLA